MPRASIAIATALLLAVAFLPTGATAQVAATQVTGLTVEQGDWFATLAWSPVEGATDYQIERTPVDVDDEPTGEAVITGLWRPNRQINQSSPTFADAGFVPGERFRWRVRARIEATPQDWSEPVHGTTKAPFGPEEFLTQFERTQGAQYTSYDNEIAWTYELAAASDRVRVVTIGHTVQGREINAFLLGYPAPPATAEQISAGPSAGSTCNVHGNEPTGREACFAMIRHMAFSDDPWVIDILSNTTALFVPSLNGDGRAANTRGNATGQDLNRDYGVLSQPETFAQAAFWRDYTPEVLNDGHHFGRTSTCDLPLMNTPHLNNAPSTYAEGRFGMIEGWMYGTGAEDGWWPCPYPVAFSPGGQSFGSTTGLKHIIGMLTEARSPAGPTRPGMTGAANTRRQTASHIWTLRQVFDYHREHRARIQQAIADSIAFQSSNIGPVVFGGTYDWEPEPAPHPGDNPPPNRRPTPDSMIEEPPCGYLLTAEQYTTPLADGGSLPVELRTSPQQRLAAHGIEVHPRASDYLVRMDQPLRGLIPLILDGQTEAIGAPIIIAAERVFDDAVCASTFSLASAQLDALVASGGITAGLEAKIRRALAQAELWLSLDKQRPIAHTHLDRAVHLLLWQADVVDRGKTNQGDAAGLRALAASIQALADTYRQ